MKYNNNLSKLFLSVSTVLSTIAEYGIKGSAKKSTVYQRLKLSTRTWAVALIMLLVALLLTLRLRAARYRRGHWRGTGC